MAHTRKPTALVACALVASLCAAAAAEPAPLEVVERAAATNGAVVAGLANGLTVIVKATRNAPVVCVRGYVRAGGLYEREYLGCGISHLVEHLVAKGAVHDHGPSAGAPQPEQTRSRVTEIGGQSNAYTSMDHTCYYISAAAGKTMECVDLIADWLARPKITSEDFEREHGVVQREIEMGMDDAQRQMWYAFAANVFGTHPAAVPVIGYRPLVAKLTLDDVLAYHRRMYIPQDMVFCVVGDVDVDAVIARTQKAFAGFERGRVPDLSLPEVQPIAGVRRTVRGNRMLKEVLEEVSFQTVPLAHEDLYALDVLSYVLGHGPSSRLSRGIYRRQGLVTNIRTSSWTPTWGKGVFSVFFRADSPAKADAAEKAVLEALKKVIDEGVEDAELAKAKRMKGADFVHAQETVQEVSATLATDYLTTGDASFLSGYTERIQAVTAEQVRAAARKYFDFDRMAVTRLVPMASFQTAAAEGAAAKKAEASVFTLPNGLRVVLSPTDSVGLVAMAFVSRGGVLLEDEKTNGMGRLTSALAVRGAGKRSAEEIMGFFNAAGGGISGDCGNQTFYWQASVLADRFGEALEIFADVIRRPTYADEELKIFRARALAQIDRMEEDWRGQVQRYFREKFFVNSPYRFLPVGRKEVVAAVTTKQLAAYHRRHVLAGSSVLAIYGNFDGGAAREAVARLFAGLPKGEVKLRDAAPREVKGDEELAVLPTDNEVAAIMVAAPGMKLTNLQDRMPITVLDTIISGFRLPSGWLHEELRGKQLVYVVHAYNQAGLAPGAFIVYAACQPEKAPQVVDIIRKNLARAAGYTPTRKEIDRAVNIILTAELLENQTMGDLSMSAALNELYGFGYDFNSRLESYYRKVTPAEVARVAKKYLTRGFVIVATTPKDDLLRPKGGD